MEKQSPKPTVGAQFAVKKPFFRRDPLTSVVAIVIVYILSQILAAIIISLYPLIRNWTEEQAGTWLTDAPTAQFFYILFAEIFAITMVFYLISWARVTKERMGMVKVKLMDFGYAAVAYGLYFISYLVIVTLTSWLIPSLNFDQEQQIGFESAISTIDLSMAFISLVILPPLAEEIMFRGFLFTSLRAKFDFRIATLITSILFGFAHLQFGAGAPLLWVAALDTFVLSVFLCYLRDRSGSLWPPIFLHGLKNLVAFTILFGSRF